MQWFRFSTNRHMHNPKEKNTKDQSQKWRGIARDGKKCWKLIGHLSGLVYVPMIPAHPKCCLCPCSSPNGGGSGQITMSLSHFPWLITWTVFSPSCHFSLSWTEVWNLSTQKIWGIDKSSLQATFPCLCGALFALSRWGYVKLSHRRFPSPTSFSDRSAAGVILFCLALKKSGEN